MKMRAITVITAGCAVSANIAMAQDVLEAGEVQFNENEITELYDGSAWSVQNAYGLEVEGANGEIVGTVEDFVLSTQGNLIALIAEVGGFWDLGDTHVSIPWEEVEFEASGPVAVPLTEENVENYDLFTSAGLSGTEVETEVAPGTDAAELGGEYWRASEVVDTYARVRSDGETWANFGFVRDILIDEQRIKATVVNTTAAHGPSIYAYRYEDTQNRGEQAWWQPGDRTYDIPVLVEDTTDQAEFEPNRMNRE
ncbi:PRC-barrel domain-containing protein [Roseivivax sp. THAF30]|uniref:PRC-barrel domain-containing protein n=1 Tax=Roseivivax sp. THAF30 TaxID=2587852 RepID=UPI001268B9E1|nr:PRC-barrel domain-containing protein [Roseivivax sp. THAF30]QFT63302.1 PRC-barrel domain protein [Roseivivax sp. THAF30]